MSDKVPSEEECMELLKQYNVPENIVEHSIRVKEVALKIARALKEKGVNVDERLVVAAEAILNGELKTLEEKIVYYADKRVLGGKIVSLKERFDYLKERYGLKNKEMKKNIEKSYPKVVELEKELLGWTQKKLL